MEKKKLWPSLVVFIGICLAIELIAGYWTNETVSTWYPKLVKPFWTPPGWVFGPVWTVLYLLIAVSGWLIYKAESSRERSIGLMFYSVQLVLNFTWSFFFFSLQSPLLGLINILLLCFSIILTMITTWKVNRLVSFLFSPYLIWVVYATSLNLGIWLLND